MSYKISQMK